MNPSLAVDPSSEISHIIEQILQKRVAADGTTVYLLRWRGMGPAFDTWEPECRVPVKKKERKGKEKKEKRKEKKKIG